MAVGELVLFVPRAHRARPKRTKWKRTKLKAAPSNCSARLSALSQESQATNLKLFFPLSSYFYLLNHNHHQVISGSSEIMARRLCKPASAQRRQTCTGAPIVVAFLLAGLLATALPAVPVACKAQELDEGLALGGAHAAGSQEQQWPVGQQQLDKLKTEASKISAFVDQNVILNCPVHFADGQEKPFVVYWLKYPDKLPIYIWYPNYPPHVAQHYEKRLTRLGQASLNLSMVREHDSGLYECRIYYLERGQQQRTGAADSSARSATNGTWILLDVQAPPHFLQAPPPISYVQAGDSLRLPCQAQSTPAPILRWYKNKVPIESDAGPYRLLSAMNAASEQSASGDAQHSQQQQQQHRQAQQTSSSQLDLLIDNIQAGQTTGEYVCLASNSEGSIEARSQVVLAVPAVITTVPRNQTRIEGERVEIPCQAKALPANITYKWFFNDKPMQQNVEWFQSRFNIKHDGTLIIHSVHRDNQGEYKCQATNGLAHRTRQQQQAHWAGPSASAKSKLAPIYAEASAYLQVEYMARVTYSPPVQYLPVGLSGIIRCFVQASPPVEFYTWTLNNQQFDPNTDPNVERLSNGSLLIKQVSKQYEGKYRCTPFNKHGSAGSSNAMDVRVEEPPHFELRPADFYKANLNGTLKIPCDARGSPKPSVTWRRVMSGSSTLIEAAGQHERSERSTNSLTAIATNRTKSTRLAKRRLAPIDQADLTNSDEPTDEAHHFYAQATTPTNYQPQDLDVTLSSNQVPNYQDERARQPIQEQPTVIVSYAKLPFDRSEIKNSHLYLRALRKEDHGRYECVIENEVALLVAPTTIYIEETTPHAPIDVRVETKAWSARVSWTPGYDGGFEQSFVVWYRQVEHSAIKSIQQTSTVASDKLHAPSNELIDINWHSANVQPSDATSFTVQNLSQDTTYEFYVRAKNIIGEGPRSQVVQASTKPTIVGSVTPISAGVGKDLVAAASWVPGSEQDEPGPTQLPVGSNNKEDMAASATTDSSGAAATAINIRHPLLIIHPEYTSSSSAAPSEPSPAAKGAEDIAAAEQQLNGEPLVDGSNSTQNNKTIQIYISLGKQLDSANASNGVVKRPRTEQRQAVSNSSALESNSTFAQVFISVDNSTAPQNLTMAKVAQGWVLSWQVPQRAPDINDLQQEIPAEPMQRQQQQLLSAPLSQIDESAPVALFGGGGGGSSSSVQRLPGQQQAQVVYSVEQKEKSSAQWHTLETTPEQSLLLKDLRPGGEYSFRVVARAANGAKGAPSPEFKYQISDNRRKPGGTQALSAGVVSGVLFFIACIVIAVCGVNMCNKRRKKRAEKAAYVMMACPVLESHHDIAALNSNSLIKNSSRDENAAQDRVSSLRRCEHAQRSSQDGASWWHFTSSRAKLRKLIESAACLAGQNDNLNRSACTNRYDCGRMQPRAGGEHEREIDFSSNEPFPVDVEGVERPVLVGQNDSKSSMSRLESGTINEVNTNSRTTPLDDYWIRQPSDRKWGTLTLAASKLAERQALAKAIKEAGRVASIAGTNKQQCLSTSGENCVPIIDGARTLPRSFRSAPLPPAHGGMFSPLQLVQSYNVRQTSPPVPARRSAAQAQCAATMLSPMALHKRSVSHVEAPQRALASCARPSGAAQWWWWSYNWQASEPLQQQQAQKDFASMSFGPPAEMVASSQRASCQNSQLASSVWWPNVTDENQPHYVQSLTNFAKRNSLARSTLPIASQAVSMGTTGWTVPAPPSNPAQEHDEANFEPFDAALDDPLRNACFGSYKRKRRLPHIEAQFTITPSNQLDESHRPAPPRPPRNERDALQNGQLFVRELNHQSTAGLPQSGQRTEVLKSRVSAENLIPPVDSIDAREKIETFLRNQPAVFEQAEATNRSPVQLDQVDELLFQPYYNLPSLKYSISLPLHRSSDGTMMIHGNSHLRPRKRRSLNKMLAERSAIDEAGSMLSALQQSSTPRELDQRKATVLSECHNNRHQHTRIGASRRQRLGSSSSCPATGAESLVRERKAGAVAAIDSSLLASTDGRSLESALGNPTVTNRPVHIAVDGSTMPYVTPDSLEHIDYRKLVANRKADVLTSDNMVTPPLRPPPVPPHRGQPMNRRVSDDESLQTGSLKDRTNQQQSSLVSPSPASSASSSSSSSSSSGRGNNSGDKSETTTTTNDNHSVDDHYEFDQVSNCSSSRTGALRRRMDKMERNQQGSKIPKHRATKSPIYTQVDKNKLIRTKGTQNETDKRSVLERSRFYDDHSRKKEQTIFPSVSRRTEISPKGNVYDTVFESASQD